jgi:hypothetical protein
MFNDFVRNRLADRRKKLNEKLKKLQAVRETTSHDEFRVVLMCRTIRMVAMLQV